MIQGQAMLLVNPDTRVQSNANSLRIGAVWLYHVEGLTQNDVAQRLNINRVTVVRLLADAKRRNEVRLTTSAPLASLVEFGRTVETRLGIDRVVVAPFGAAEDDPVRAIAAAAENFIKGRMQSCMTVGVGWARALYHSLSFITGGTLADFRVVSLLGGVAAARRFNPTEFAWQFAELFQGEGFLNPAPACAAPACSAARVPFWAPSPDRC
jgi:deoxyribonucleoside regulator